jgi:hypothetical protein
MEYVDAPSLASGVTRKWSEEHRGQLVCFHITDDKYDDALFYIQQMTSIRHGVRVLQHADITQHDWHAGQILCHLPPSGSQAHTVFIDFAATTQTLDLDVDLSEYSKDDYGGCLVAITTSVRDNVAASDMLTKWVCEYWDRDEMKRECWDANELSVAQGEHSWTAHAVDPYKFVYDGLDSELGQIQTVPHWILHPKSEAKRIK